VKRDYRRYIDSILEAIGNIKRYLIKGASKVRKNPVLVVAIATLIAAVLACLYPVYLEHGEREDLKSQIDSSLREADSLRDAGSFEEAIGEYKSILKMVSPKKFPDSYATTQNNIGAAYWNLAGVRNKEANLEKAINAYQEALKIYTVESYPINYATTQNYLGVAYSDLAEVRDKEANLEKAINAYQEALKIRTVERYPINYATRLSNPNLSIRMSSCDTTNCASQWM